MRNNAHSLRTIACGSWKHDLRVVTFGAGPKCHASIKGKHMDKWTELRTALSVARLGTVSAAAEALNIHRATVNRHIDALEDELGTRVFIRHARGYTLTDAGEDVLRVAQKTHDMLQDLSGRVQGKTSGIEGEIKVTVLPVFANLLMSAINNFRAANSACRVVISATEDLARLEYAEAHLAIRAGAKPEHPDYVVQPYTTIPINLYAHQSYIDRHGRPKDERDFADHAFIGSEPSIARGPFSLWLLERIQPDQIALASNEARSREEAIYAGIGIGFLSAFEVRERPQMVKILPDAHDWSIPLWLVTHVDLHRTAKVQAMLDQLKNNRPSQD